MIPLLRLLALIPCVLLSVTGGRAEAQSTNGNRLTYLDESDPFYVALNFPKLITPQWVGEPGVDAVVTLAVDDMTDPKKYEAFLRPILERLKQIDGRAPVSIMTIKVDPQDGQLQSWLKEGLSLEVHTLTHPCPCLQKSNFVAAADIVHGGVDLMSAIPGNHPVAYRMPCCDSMNSASPRFYAEIFNQASPARRFLTLDSSVMNLTTANDKSLASRLVVDGDGQDKFLKYLALETNEVRKVSMKSFSALIEDYPYPFVIGRLCWEFPPMYPSDWAAFNLHGATNPVTLADWKAALDVAVIKQGTFNFVFHPHGWSGNDQVVELIDYAVKQYGGRVKFLTFREAQERLDKFLLAGQPLRAANGQDNGVRLLDVNNDGYMDVIIANGKLRRTRVWLPAEKTWSEPAFPTALVTTDDYDNHQDSGARFGVMRADGKATVFYRTELGQGAWHFDGSEWVEDKTFFRGLEQDGQPVRTREAGHDRGVRLRDLNNDGRCELIVGNDGQNAVFSWSEEEKSWQRLPYALPRGTSIVNEQGHDNGLRFVDLNHDGLDDVLFSNEKAYSVHLFVPVERRDVDWLLGWTQEFRSGKRGDPDEIPMIVRGGEHPNNGVWFRRSTMWVQNEDTAHLPDKVDRRSFEVLLTESGPPPRPPAESLAAIRVRPGFKVELVAHEPLVMDPVAFDWGADGKLWVVEMGDYPRGADGHGKFGGVVRFLEDTNSDGVYDKSTVFLEGLGFPNGVMPWGKGVLISCAPDIIYAEDTDGDGKADVRKALFTGFAKGNQQHRMNGFEYGLDNWIYGANGDSGGVVTSLATGKKVSISGRDFRFRPDDGAFQSETGHTQFGRRRDDWGNWFGNNNSSWGWHDLVPERYLVRNPHLAVRATVREYATYTDAHRVYPSSAAMRRFNWPGAVNTVTSACSASPYRDELFGPEFASSIFICEPVHNVVHREVLEPDGVTFTSHRANDEQSSEFLASADNWSRFVFCKIGPDGALYIADMYRLVIEHPEWIPAEVQKRLDVRAGHDKGRIYRVYPADAKLRATPRLDKLNTVSLVAALNSPNGWQRDTVQRLLVHAYDSAAVKPLAALAAETPNPKVRLQALCTLDGLDALTPAIVETALKDKHPAVREQAVRVSETLLSKSPAVATSLLKLVDDPEIRVRYQLAFSLGELKDPRAGVGLAKLAVRDFENPQMRIAVMSSATRHVGAMLAGILSDRQAAPPADVLEQLINLAVVLDDRDALVKSLGEASKPMKEDHTAWRFSSVAGLLDGLERRNLSLKKFHAEARPEMKEAIQKLDSVFAEARNVATDSHAREADRLSAIRLVGRGLDAQSQETESLGELLRPQEPMAIQQAALTGLGRGRGERVARILLGGWRGYSPTLRAEVLEVLCRRQEWISALLGAIERGETAAGQISAAHQQKLLGHSQAVIRERATRLFAATDSDRQKVVKQYEGVSDLVGGATQGHAIYQQTCSVCHRLKGEGNEAGPDLGSVADKPMAQLLEGILDPNRAVEARYFSYTAVTKSDREVTGIIAVETPNSITLKTATGTEEVILRSDLKELKASGLSLMPDGLENNLKPQDLADVIAYIKAGR